MFDDELSLTVFETTHDADVVLFFILQYALLGMFESFIACGLACT